MSLTALCCWIAAFLIGGIPFGYLVGRFVLQDDIRRHGSGNIGATNVARVIGWKWGGLVLLLDALKGLAPTLGTRLLLQTFEPANDPQNAVVVAGVAAITGHMYPVYLRLRGGKGVATALGVVCVLAPRATVVAFVVFLVFALSTRLIALASMSAAMAFLIMQAWLLGTTAFAAESLAISLFSLAIPLLIIWRHRTNIARILQGTEPTFGTAVGRTDDAADAAATSSPHPDE